MTFRLCTKCHSMTDHPAECIEWGEDGIGQLHSADGPTVCERCADPEAYRQRVAGSLADIIMANNEILRRFGMPAECDNVTTPKPV